MTLGQKQELFARYLPRLIDEAHRQGFDVRLKELLRGEQQALWNSKHCGVCNTVSRGHDLADHDFKPIGIAESLHCLGLAIDLVLFRDGRPLWASDRYKALGEWWERLDPACAWGGRFNDAGHFSIQHGGKK